MTTKKSLQILVIVGLLLAAFMPFRVVQAWSNCGSYYTVQWGDTLSGIAAWNKSSVEAIQNANPGLGWWVYAGQVLCIPGSWDSGYQPAPGDRYTVQWGDTLGTISQRAGVSLRDLLAVNPQIWNPSRIYVGQLIYLPVGASQPAPRPKPGHTPPPPTSSDHFSTLKIDYKYGLYVRREPGGKIISSALDKTIWYYKPSSVFVDSKWKVWVEVKVYPPIDGSSTGWILVKDQLGTYFTDPPIH